MSKGIATLAALGMIGAGALGLEALAVTRIAEGAGGWLAGAEAFAVGRAGRIVAATIARSAGDRARDVALAAALGAMRSAGWLFELTRAPDAPPAGARSRSAPAEAASARGDPRPEMRRGSPRAAARYNSTIFLLARCSPASMR